MAIIWLAYFVFLILVGIISVALYLTGIFQAVKRFSSLGLLAVVPVIGVTYAIVFLTAKFFKGR